MFTKKITESDAFLDMPTSTQALYFHLCMSADDDGFVSNPKTIKRIVGASDDDMKLLLLKRFIISFESGIIVIKHWRMHNYIAKDRYRETEYLDEKNLLFVKPNKAYTLTDNGHKASDMYNSCIQNVDNSYTGPYTQNRIDKNSIEEDSIDKTSIGECEAEDTVSIPYAYPTDTVSEKPKKTTQHDLLLELLPNYDISCDVAEAISGWLEYKAENKKSYKRKGMHPLLKRLSTMEKQHGAQYVIDTIEYSMSQGWQGIYEKDGGKASKADTMNDWLSMQAGGMNGGIVDEPTGSI